jgi:hypothetical protein
MAATVSGGAEKRDLGTMATAGCRGSWLRGLRLAHLQRGGDHAVHLLLLLLPVALALQLRPGRFLRHADTGTTKQLRQSGVDAGLGRRGQGEGETQLGAAGVAITICSRRLFFTSI